MESTDKLVDQVAVCTCKTLQRFYWGRQQLVLPRSMTLILVKGEQIIQCVADSGNSTHTVVLCEFQTQMITQRIATLSHFSPEARV